MQIPVPGTYNAQNVCTRYHIPAWSTFHMHVQRRQGNWCILWGFGFGLIIRAMFQLSLANAQYFIWCLNCSRSAVSLISFFVNEPMHRHVLLFSLHNIWYLAVWTQCFDVGEPDIVSFNMNSVLCNAIHKPTLTFIYFFMIEKIFAEMYSGTMSWIKNHFSARMIYPAFKLMSWLQAHYIIIKSDKKFTECQLISPGTGKELMQVLVEHSCRSSNAHMMFLSVEC